MSHPLLSAELEADNDDCASMEKAASNSSASFRSFGNRGCNCGGCACRILLLPLNILTLPLMYLMQMSCWNKRRFFKYDFCVQLMTVFQVLIGVLWNQFFMSFILWMEPAEQSETVHESINVASYTFALYLACNLIVVVLQRHHCFQQNSLFFIGILGHIVAFGVKSLAFQIMQAHFSASFQHAVAYFWTCLALSIIAIYGLSFIRKHFCFVVDELREQTAEFRERMSNKIRFALQRSKARTVEIYEDDIVDMFELNEESNDDAHPSDDKRETFNDLIKEIDSDAFTIALAAIFVELILFAISGSFRQIDTEHSEPLKAVSLATQAKNIFMQVSLTAIPILFVFWLYTFIMGYIQMRRDRMLYKLFQELQLQQQHSEQRAPLMISAANIAVHVDENCCLAACIKCSYKSYKLSDKVIAFTIGFLGYSFGWTFICGGYAFETVNRRFFYSLAMTTWGILAYFLRSQRMYRRFQKWHSNVENRNVNDEVGDAAPFGYDMYEAKAKQHQRLYSLSNENLFFRKAFGMIVALPWEMTFDLAIENKRENGKDDVLYRFIVTVATTIVLSYAGIQLIRIQSMTHHHSIHHAMQKIIRGNHIKLKQFTKSSNE